MKFSKDELWQQGLIKDPDWFELLYPFLTSEEFGRIVNTIRMEKEQGISIYPKNSQIFRAFNETPLKDLRVTILGQDPYPIKGDACGVAFMVEREDKLPKSLQFIHGAIEENIYKGLDVTEFPRGGDLLYLARQGVLLLNSALTVHDGKPDSHAELWKPFMDYTIEALQSVKKELIFLLWGKRAQGYVPIINPFTHFVLTAPHPASAAYNGGTWTTDNFSRTNTIIKINKLGEPIKW